MLAALTGVELDFAEKVCVYESLMENMGMSWSHKYQHNVLIAPMQI